MISVHLWFEALNLLLYSSVRIDFGVGVFLVDMFETLAFIYRVPKIIYKVHLFLLGAVGMWNSPLR